MDLVAFRKERFYMFSWPVARIKEDKRGYKGIKEIKGAKLGPFNSMTCVITCIFPVLLLALAALTFVDFDLIKLPSLIQNFLHGFINKTYNCRSL